MGDLGHQTLEAALINGTSIVHNIWNNTDAPSEVHSKVEFVLNRLSEYTPQERVQFIVNFASGQDPITARDIFISLWWLREKLGLKDFDELFRIMISSEDQIFAASQVINFALSYHFNFEPMAFYMLERSGEYFHLDVLIQLYKQGSTDQNKQTILMKFILIKIRDQKVAALAEDEELDAASAINEAIELTGISSSEYDQVFELFRLVDNIRRSQAEAVLKEL